jgi:hypothetical protein
MSPRTAGEAGTSNHLEVALDAAPALPDRVVDQAIACTKADPFEIACDAAGAFIHDGFPGVDEDDPEILVGALEVETAEVAEAAVTGGGSTSAIPRSPPRSWRGSDTPSTSRPPPTAWSTRAAPPRTGRPTRRSTPCASRTLPACSTAAPATVAPAEQLQFGVVDRGAPGPDRSPVPTTQT